MASSDYISREAICLTDFEIAMCNGDYKELCKMILDKIANAPAADVVEVVRCKDCTHCKKGKASLECEKHTYAWNNMRRWVDEDDFCKWGVKREES